jgi:hypothetical protein
MDSLPHAIFGRRPEQPLRPLPVDPAQILESMGTLLLYGMEAADRLPLSFSPFPSQPDDDAFVRLLDMDDEIPLVFAN